MFAELVRRRHVADERWSGCRGGGSFVAEDGGEACPQRAVLLAERLDLLAQGHEEFVAGGSGHLLCRALGRAGGKR